MPRKQNESRTAAWVVAHAAPSAGPQVRTRASGRRVNANPCRACVEVHHAPIEANEADPARAVGTLSALHAPTRTMRFSTVELGGLGSACRQAHGVCVDTTPRVNRDRIHRHLSVTEHGAQVAVSMCVTRIDPVLATCKEISRGSSCRGSHSPRCGHSRLAATPSTRSAPAR
jgi:hypothetical protein